MKFSLFSTTAVLLASGLLEQAIAQQCFSYWEGTAPFCDPSCPATKDGRACKGTGRYSSFGNGGSCWTGRKQICECCGAVPTTPSEHPACLNPVGTDVECAAFVLICTNFGIDAQGLKRPCGSYACGACLFG